MSTPSSEKVPPAPAPSEQLFDELDSLLQRMLALPVNQTVSADGARPADDEEDVDELPPDMPLITIAEASLDPATEASLPQSPLSVTQEPFYQPPPEPAVEQPYRPPTVPPPPISIRSDPKPEVRPPRQTDPNLPPTTSDEPSSSWKAPFLWCNQAFDAFTVPLGSLGSWLRGPSGRRLLGLMGVTLIVLACGLVARDWFGWTW